MPWCNPAAIAQQRTEQVPNQTLLQYFGAHGLRHAFFTRGGCYGTAEWLGVDAIPGKWNDALLTPEVTQLRESGKLAGDGLVGTFIGGRGRG